MTLENSRKAGFAALLMLCFTSGFSQFDTTDISARLNRSREKLGKEIAFELYKDGKVLYKKEMGGFSIKTPEPIWASSQWLTTALVMTFVQEGKITLEDKVSTYLPVFTSHFKSYITIRQCLTNFTGIQSEQGVAKLLQKNKFKTLEEAVDNFASKREIETNAGTEFKYSNIGYNIAGRVLEVITKRTFDRLMQERIIRPLAMKNTTFSNEDYNDAIDPATGAKSSVADYTNFLSMLLNKGMFNGKQVLTESSVEIMHTLQAATGQVKYAPPLVSGLGYGLGEWILESNAQGKPNVVAVPSLRGSWSMIDLCRGYTFVLFTRQPFDEVVRNVYMDIKSAVDEAVGGNCP